MPYTGRIRLFVAHVISALQTISRNLHPLDVGVASVTGCMG